MLPSQHSLSKLPRHKSFENLHSQFSKSVTSFGTVIHARIRNPHKIQSIDDTYTDYKNWNIQQEMNNSIRYNVNESLFLNNNSWNTKQMISHRSNTIISNDHNNIISSRTCFEELDHQVLDQKKRRRQQKYYNKCCCSCTPLCKLLSLLAIFFLIGVITALLGVLLIKPNTTTTKDSTSILTSTISTSTSTTTTTTEMLCSFSCLNRTWISSSALLAKWTFDGHFFDETNNFNGIAVDNPSFVTNGYVNEAIWFSSNQYLYTSYIPLSSTSFTIEGWIFPTGYPNSKDHSILGLCTNPFNNQCLHLTIRKTGSLFSLYLSFFGDNCLGISNVKLFKWTHVAFIFDMSTYAQSIYIDGIFDKMCISATPLLATSGSLTIGYVPGIVSANGNNFFQGYIDHLTIFNRVKTSCEILDDASLVTHFTFDNSSLLVDSGPNTLQSIQQSISSVLSGHSSQAINFNESSSSFVQISGLTALGIVNQSFSISLWIQPRILKGILIYISKTSSGTQWSIPMIGFAINGSLIGQILDTEIISISDLTTLTILTWSHIVLTWSSTNGLRLYVNNILVASSSSATSYSASSSSNYLILGNSPTYSSTCTVGLIPLQTPFNGDIDELRVYNRELSINDICALYRN